jgi:glutaminyl-peptide cyclotransferase
MRAILTLGIFLELLLVTASCARSPQDLFDETRAFGFLVGQCEVGCRVPGTPEHEKGKEYILGALRRTSAKVEVQPFRHTTADGRVLELTNILAKWREEERERILLCAHWDSRPFADRDPVPKNRRLPVPGADDGASGVAVLLEIARCISRVAPPVGVDMVFFDGEDFGSFARMEDVLIGSRYFAAGNPGYRPRAGILIDMVGDRNLQILQEGYSRRYDPKLVQRIWRIAGELGYAGEFLSAPGGSIIDDHVPLNRAGIPCIVLIDINYAYWHTREDTPEHCSPDSLKILGRVLLKLIYEEK